MSKYKSRDNDTKLSCNFEAKQDGTFKLQLMTPSVVFGTET